MSDEPDRDLLARFIHGDRDAFEALFRRFERDVFRWIVRIVRDAAAADDAVVETFWRAYRSRARFDPGRPFGAWLRRIATRAALDQLNDARRRGWMVAWTSPGGGAALGPPGRGDALRGGPADAADLRDSIAHAFAALAPKLRVVAALALIEEQPLADIADALDVPVGTIKSRLFRATRQLRAELIRLGVHV